jgi:hypothetical protein
MTRGERYVRGVTLHEVMAYRWGLYMASTDSRQTWESGVGYWTLTYTDPTTLVMSHVDTAHSLGDAVTISRHHEQRLRDES